MAASFSARLLGSTRETAEVRTFRLEVPGDFTFTPGMWVMLHFPDDPGTSRAYSMSSSPLEKGYIEVTVGRAGEFTERLFSLAPGAALGLRGPYGKWLFRDDIKEAAFVSGGTGVSPFRSMVRYALGKGLPTRMSLFHCMDHTGEVLFAAELEEFRRKGVRVALPPAAPAAEDLERDLPAFRETHFFLCGPNRLVSSLSEGLSARGIPKAQIHYEKWGDYQL